jgi:DNA-directed RNA polymerase specialized sigma24 family protein
MSATLRGEALVEGRSKEDAAADADAFRQHLAALGRVCMALLGDADQVTRALEEVATKVAAGGCPAGASPRSWLMGLARAACAVRLTSGPARRTSRPADGDTAPDTVRDGGEATRARRALAALKPTEREAIVLHLVGGIDVDEVAAASGLAPDVARARIARGVATLMDARERDGEGSR